jgi:hypothetical protein
MKRFFLVLLAGIVAFAPALAQKEHPLTRDEVSVIKKKLVATLESLGQPQAGYAVEDEDFNLPTEAYPSRSADHFSPASASASRKYGTEKATQKSSEEMSKEYQKKMLEAQAKGDYTTMSKLAQEMQQQMSASQLKSVEGHKEPIQINVQFNSNPGTTIDPDAVIFERPGVIALIRQEDKSTDKAEINVYVDPVALKDTKQLSTVKMSYPEDGVTKRVAVLNATITLHGPKTEIETWAKRIDTKKVLAQIN